MGSKAPTFGRWEFSASVTDGPGFGPASSSGQLTESGRNTSSWTASSHPSTANAFAAWQPSTTPRTTLQKSTEYDADFNQPHIWVVEWRPNAYVIYFDSKQIVNVTDKTLIPTTPHHFVAQTDMGSWADVPTSKEPTRIELALDYVKQWSYLGS